MFNRGGNDGFFDVGNCSAEGRSSWNTPIQVGKWYHAVLTYNGSKVRAYINGELVGEATLTGSIADSSYDINIGRNPVYGGDYFKGVIDEVRIFNRTLSEEEIKASYNAGLYRLYHNFTNLENGKYQFKAYAQDLAGNLNETEGRTITIDPPDTTPPIITFVPPTPANGSTVDYIFVNVTANEDLNMAILEWNGVNHTMQCSGNNCHLNMTGLANGDYWYRVYANDSAGNMNVSEMRVVTVAVSTPTPSPTPTAPMDSDGDGVLDGVEDNAPNGGDGNYDGVRDSMQEWDT